MGYYHLSVSIIGRGTGRSAVACAAYRSGAILADNRYGRIHDYSSRRGIFQTGIDAPDQAPHWVRDRELLWNRVEAGERRKDAQLAREFVLAFPHQLDAEQRLELLHTFITEQITSRGLVADWAIHAPNRAGDERNWHAHVLTTMREIAPSGFAATKDRSLNATEQLVIWREAWADLQNKLLEQVHALDTSGQVVHVDHRSYLKQGIDLEPMLHMGVHATAMERRGHTTERGELNRAVTVRNGHEPVKGQSLESQAQRTLGTQAQRSHRSVELELGL